LKPKEARVLKTKSRRIVLGGSKKVSKQKADSRQATAQSFSKEEIVEIPWHRGIPIARPSVGLS
jgi:hypothetical protein